MPHLSQFANSRPFPRHGGPPLQRRPSPVARRFSQGTATPIVDRSLVSLTSMPKVTRTSKLKKRKTTEGFRIINEYAVLKEIGRGTCGKVSLALDIVEHRLVAIKEVQRAERKQRLGGKTVAQQRFESALREIDVMTKLRHKNIVSVYNVIDDSNADSVYIVMQYVENGPIATIRVVEGTDQVCEPMPPQRLAAAARQMLAGLEYLHRKNVVHRDIKPDNILMDKDGRVYLADFGVAETFDTQHRERMERAMQESMAQSLAMSVTGGVLGSGPKVLGTKGTPLFIAPELYSGERSYGKPVDMWALGVTLFTLLTGRLPFRNPGEVTDPNLPVFPEAYGAEWAALLRGMLTQDPAARLTAAQARAMVKAMDGVRCDAQSEPLAADDSHCLHDSSDSLDAHDAALGSTVNSVSFAESEGNPTVDFGLSENPSFCSANIMASTLPLVLIPHPDRAGSTSGGVNSGLLPSVSTKRKLAATMSGVSHGTTMGMSREEEEQSALTADSKGGVSAPTPAAEQGVKVVDPRHSACGHPATNTATASFTPSPPKTPRSMSSRQKVRLFSRRHHVSIDVHQLPPEVQLRHQRALSRERRRQQQKSSQSYH